MMRPPFCIYCGRRYVGRGFSKALKYRTGWLCITCEEQYKKWKIYDTRIKDARRHYFREHLRNG